MDKPTCCSCVELVEDQKYSLIFEDDKVIIRKSDDEHGGYFLHKLGAIPTGGAEGKHLKINLFFSFEEAE